MKKGEGGDEKKEDGTSEVKPDVTKPNPPPSHITTTPEAPHRVGRNRFDLPEE